MYPLLRKNPGHIGQSFGHQDRQVSTSKVVSHHIYHNTSRQICSRLDVEGSSLFRSHTAAIFKEHFTRVSRDSRILIIAPKLGSIHITSQTGITIVTTHDHPANSGSTIGSCKDDRLIAVYANLIQIQREVAISCCIDHDITSLNVLP